MFSRLVYIHKVLFLVLNLVITFESQSLLKQSLGCRIENGSAINILEDPWLPLEHDAYIHTNSLALQGQMVSSLMDGNSNLDIDLVMNVFDNTDANIVLSIPLDTEV